jgi:hypothetical protein
VHVSGPYTDVHVLWYVSRHGTYRRVFILVLCGAQTDRLKKKFSTDFMAKDSAVWIDPQKRSLHWYETHCVVCSLCTAGVSSMR